MAFIVTKWTMVECLLESSIHRKWQMQSTAILATNYDVPNGGVANISPKKE
jgi:hypothetical protein